MSRAKDVGTRAESAVAAYLGGERRPQTGSRDQGDVWAYGGRVVVEVKSRREHHTLAAVRVWLGQAEREAQNAADVRTLVDMALLVVKRVGSGPANVGDWHAYMSPQTAAWLLTGTWADVDGAPWGTTLEEVRRRLDDRYGATR
ncbi:MAG: hypothetical protein RLZ55_1452 [Actinomycetota bacterium]